ncbi:MAG: redox-sensing transcriptional repressor Rex, partial [Oscillospiraceae bacterium]|nr:redox-sensing transcriptional repressor Rex [Oscillospiraceae bacterium]
YSMDELEKYLDENKADIAVLTVPKTAAVPVTERLTASGIDAIWNFTNVELTEPNSSTIVENVHFSDSLLSLSYFVAERRDEAAAKAAREEK